MAGSEGGKGPRHLKAKKLDVEPTAEFYSRYPAIPPTCERRATAVPALPLKSLAASLYNHNEGSGELDEVFAELDELGAEAIRVDFRWAEIEIYEGQFVWDMPGEYNYYDDLMAHACASDVQIVATLTQAPNWANNGAGDRLPTKDHLRDYQKYLFKTVSRYKPGSSALS